MTSQIQDKIEKDLAKDKEELLENDQEILRAESLQQTQIKALNEKLDLILKQMEKR